MEVRDMVIGTNIAHVRIANGDTQSSLASKLGVSRSLIAQYETGRKHADDAFLDRLIALYGCTKEELTRVSAEDLKEASSMTQTAIGAIYSRKLTNDMVTAYKDQMIRKGFNQLCVSNRISYHYLLLLEDSLHATAELEIDGDYPLEHYLDFNEETLDIDLYSISRLHVQAVVIRDGSAFPRKIRIPMEEFLEMQNDMLEISNVLYKKYKKRRKK